VPAATRIGDADVPHCSGMVRAVGSTSVFVNGKGAGRVGDAISGCTSVEAGSPNVFCGP